MGQEPLVAPPGAGYEERPDGFVVRASTRAKGFVVIYLSLWVLLWLGVMGNLTPMALAGHSVGARVVVTVLWLAVALQVYFWLVSVLGRYVLTVRGDQATLVLAIGVPVWRRRFLWSQVTSISWQHSSRKGAPPWIVLSGQKRVRFGSMIRTDRRMYVFEVLQHELARR